MNDWPTLPFEERQRRWSGEVREFRQHHGRNDRPTVWRIYVQGDRVYTQHGLLDGAMQDTSYQGKAKNVGRSNAITAEQDALAEARRDCRKKLDFEGYDEYFNGSNIDRRYQDISVQHLLTNLPSSFCLYKPSNNLYDQKKLLEKARKGEVVYTFKRDGLAYWVVVDYFGQVQFYSRRSRRWHDKEGPKELEDGTLDHSTVVPWSARFPHLVEAVQCLKLPPGSMMAVELCGWHEHKEDFIWVSSLTKSLTPKSLADQATRKPTLYWWDTPFLGGEDMTKRRVMERYAFITAHWSQNCYHPSVMSFIQPIQYTRSYPSPEDAADYAKSIGFEGYVVVDPEAAYGDKGWNLKGKPDRPSTCAKLKPRHEDDFVALWDPEKKWGTYGSGRHEPNKQVTLPSGQVVTHGGVGSVGLFQYNSVGELIYICDCSSGMDYEFQAQLTRANFPFVVQVEYVERTYISDGDKTNALRFPTVLRLRTDKRAEECINTRL